MRRGPDTPEPTLLGASARMQAVRERLRVLAALPWTVLIRGETGTGKGLAARFLHEASPRRGLPLFTQTVTHLPAGLELARLVGWVRGAFTGASTECPGVFEAAHGSTLFLDEIGCAAPDVQKALLQLVEDGAVRRLGELRPRTVDVRLVFATNSDLEAAVAEGVFRGDLYQRVVDQEIEMPALREHPEDIPEIATALLAHRATEAGRRAPQLTEDDLTRLQAYDWPGNVRRLDRAVKHLIAFGELPDWVAERPRDRRTQIEACLRSHNGNKAAAARQLR